MVRIIPLACFLLAAISGPAMAEEPVSVSGSFDYTPQVFARVPGGGSVFVDASEAEVWTGDIEGKSVAPFRVVVSPDGSVQAWLLAEFEGTVLGQHDGTMVIASKYAKPSASAHWTGEWIILSGTGDLENVHGHGRAWGPGFNPKDPEAGPDIFYSGQIFFPPE